MRKQLYFLSLIILASCGGKGNSEKSESGNILENLTYSVDTVVVDAGDDFLNVGYGLGSFDLTPDQDQLLFFEREPLRLVTIDLNELKVLGKVNFEKEGPNSVGSFISELAVGSLQEIFIQGFNSQGKFNTQGTLTEDLKIFPEGIAAELANDFPKLYSREVFDFETNKIYTQPFIENSKNHKVLIIDPTTVSFKEIPIPKMKIIRDFSGTYVTKAGGGVSTYYFGPMNYMEIENGQLLISGAPMSGFYRMDTKTENLEFIDIQHKTVPNEWKITVVNEPADEAVYQEDRRKVNEQLNFMDIKWDNARKMYLRFGQKTFLGEERGDPATYELYLFAYDKDFNVLGETKIDGLESTPSSYFCKDGKLYSYVNV
jgi:hypothetical protein